MREVKSSVRHEEGQKKKCIHNFNRGDIWEGEDLKMEVGCRGRKSTDQNVTDRGRVGKVWLRKIGRPALRTAEAPSTFLGEVDVLQKTHKEK